MIREERDPAFWERVGQHEAVVSRVGRFDWAPVIASTDVTPLASEHGGYLFHRMDLFGAVLDLHAAFTPEGWGREAANSLKDALERVFTTAHVVLASETKGNWRSRPPRSYGFEPAADFIATPLGDLRTWVLTRARWTASPARQRRR